MIGSKKAMAIFLAAVMVVVAIGSVLQMTDDASATEGTQAQGNVNVYFKGPGQSSASVASVDAYDLYEAVVKAGTTLGYTVQTATGNDSWNKFVYSSSGSYYDINKDYGVMTSITSGTGADAVTSNISSYSIYVYNKVLGGTVFSWNPAIDAIGWYHPYNDYSATGTVSTTNYSLASANIAIVYGSEMTPVSGMKDLVDVASNDDYLYSFVVMGNVDPITLNVTTEGAEGYEVMTVTEEDIAGGIFVYGWGSNAFEALKNALGSSNVVGQQKNCLVHDMVSYQYYTYYSWVDTILGKGTDSSTGDYHYWATYLNEDTPDNYCQYTLGYYTTVNSAFVSGNTFYVTYV